MDPEDLRVHYQIATIDLAAGKVEEARVNLEGIIKKAPKFTEAHISLAGIYDRLKRREDGDRERAIVQQLKAEQSEQEAKKPGKVE